MSHDSLIERKSILIFCNSCARFRKIDISADLREGCLCPTCGLNSRQRGILLATQLIILKRIFHYRGLKVVGVSDGEGFALGTGAGFLTATPLFHTNIFPDLTQVYLIPADVLV